MHSHRSNRRRWLAPEVIQTSAMDCGPAALKSVLEGFGISASYGRLREACQTDVDGTSIDALEASASLLGLDAEQVMLPMDHVFMAEAQALPAIVITKQANGPTHFVVVWRRHGPWLQVMDPALGRRWISCRRFTGELFRHAVVVDAEDWLTWAKTDDFLQPLSQRLTALGIAPNDRTALLDPALHAGHWLPIASIDAAARMIAPLLRTRALAPGKPALRLLQALTQAVSENPAARESIIPQAYWLVRTPPPDLLTDPADEDSEPLLMLGAVLMRVRGRRTDDHAASGENSSDAHALSPELQAALAEPPVQPERELWRLLTCNGFATPLALLCALAVSAGAVLAESLLFRGLFDISRDLGNAGQRVGALAALVAFMAILLMLEIPIAAQSLRLGRHLEVRLRMALQDRFARLGDRYFQSRPISDMAERAHGVYLTRLVPDLAIRFVKGLWDLLFTLLGIALIAPGSLAAAAAVVAVAVGVPLAAQPLLNERDLKVRSHAGALYGFYLDALQGSVAIRTHGAEAAVRREHDARLTEWSRSSRGLIAVSVSVQVFQAFGCGLGVAWMLWDCLQRSGITGNLLLLVFWALKLPAAGKQIAALTRQYPSDRNALLRLLEPLAAPPEHAEPLAASPAEPAPEPLGGAVVGLRTAVRKPPVGVTVAFRGGAVVAAGHTILHDLDLTIAPGEHVAVVGASGAGKSSLLAVLLGWHRLAEGALEVDGEPLSGPALAALRSVTAWVDPAVQLWNRPLLDNLRFSSSGPTASELGEVLEAAALRSLVKKLPAGLQTPLGESGALVSGGEGQRVRLGRALMQSDVRLALLDEPFRGLDHAQRRILLAKTRARWRHATVLCVTHDVGETLAFDRVLVVDRGRVVEDGIPEQLAAQSSLYRSMLDTEERVRRELWQAEFWRRLRVENGGLTAASGVAARDDRRSRRAGLAHG